MSRYVALRAVSAKPLVMPVLSLCLLSGFLISTNSYAHHHTEEGHGGHQQHGGEHSATHSDNPAVIAYRAANDRMHNDMNMAFTGQPDVDFAQGMIPHHEGAIAMAEIVLAHGEDDEIRQLAEDIIAAQESEIAFLKAWLARKGY